MNTINKFGGDWTNEKLIRVEKYLKAYIRIMNKQPFQLDYIDAFAGSGYREEIGKESKEQSSLFSKNDIREIETYSEGSARIALKIEPEFDKYIFIEKSKKIFNELKKLISEFPKKAGKIEIHNMEANKYISQLCNGGS